MPELFLQVVEPDAKSSVGADVVAVVSADHRIGELVLAVSEYLGRTIDANRALLGNRRTGRVAHPGDRLADVDLLSGDEVVLGSAAGELVGPIERSSTWSLDVIAGPDSARSFPIPVGASTVGRSSAAEITLADRSVSRHHATLHCSAAGVLELSVAPTASNGATVDGRPVAAGAPVVVSAGASIGLGGTRVVVRQVECDADVSRDRLSQIGFHRTPYRRPIVREREPEPVGPIPTRPEPRRLQLVAILAPVLAGVALYAMTRQAQFLMFTLISPVVMVGTVVDDRRSGRTSHRAAVSEFRTMLGERCAEFEQLRADERAERRRVAPDLADLVRRAEFRSVDLWERGRDAADLLCVRVGIGDDRVSYTVDVERDGDDDLRAEARTALAGLETLTDVPTTVDLVVDRLGIHGSPDLVAGVAASLAIQVATLHSPDDVVIVAVIGSHRDLGWTKWLPHLRSVTSPVGGSHLAVGQPAADALVARLLEVATFRTAERRACGDQHWPRVVAFLDADLRPDPAATARLLDLADDAGISVVWLATTAAEVPRQVTRVLRVAHGEGARLDGVLWATDPSTPERRLEVEHLNTSVAARTARWLAPVRDASTASQATSIPRTAPLLDVVGADTVGVDAVVARWQRRRVGHELSFPVGIAADGPLELDLVADGPHTLIGGTSGSGKSELLQSLVAALAINHSPERLNFLFVDYKGGASSQVFETLPHTVGYVTNLSAELSVRALTSLRAELDRRMALLEGRAKDLAEMLDRHPDDAPASLVIVVDEFATLAKEVPEFVAGVVDIAQRGRSLGIHLVLATQRPSGSVNENILANTNLRIGLRVLDRSESMAILDGPDAADIPVPLRGRAFVRLGPRRLVEFQSAFAGAPQLRGDGRRPVLVAGFDDPAAAPAPPVIGEHGSVTHLDAVLDAVGEAAAASRIPAPRRPWCDDLPEVVTLEHVLAGLDDRREIEFGRDVVVGILDQPETQSQRPAVVDLEDRGGLLVYGSGGSGKTTVLRTIAASLEQPACRAASIVFDFASRGLPVLSALASVVDVVTGDDLEAATRHLLRLDAEIERRRRLLAAHGAENLSVFRHEHGELDRVVVMIDGFGGLAAALLDVGASIGSDADRWSEIVHRIVVDGRQVGIHTVITTDRRSAIPARLQSAIGARLVLRHADPQAYADHGIPRDVGASLDSPAGRALLDGRTTVQLATVSGVATARGQADAVVALAATGRAPHPLASAALPESVPVRQLDGASAGDSAVTFGVTDIDHEPVAIDLAWSHAAVVGPARSGRTTALAAIVTGAGGAPALGDVYVVGPASSPLARLDLPRSAFGRGDRVGALLDRVANLGAVASADERLVLVVDDLDGFDDPELAPVWDRIVAAESIRVVGAVDTRAMVGYTSNAAVSELRRARCTLMLEPTDPGEFLQITGFKLPSRPGLAMVPGRGILVADRRPQVVQVADVSGAIDAHDAAWNVSSVV